MKHILKILVTLLIFASCEIETEEIYEVVLCPKERKTQAFNVAKCYADKETEYQFGGQDSLFRAIKIDCSGLVVMSYKYALVDTKYSLIENDMTASFMYFNASSKTENPETGDLIFMGEEDSDKITHVAIYEKTENDKIYFIDSTEKPKENINGVTQRFYSKSDKRIKSFGVMKLKYRE